jgi:hypothetical protein
MKKNTKNFIFALGFIILLVASGMFGVPYVTKSSFAQPPILDISQKIRGNIRNQVLSGSGGSHNVFNDMHQKITATSKITIPESNIKSTTAKSIKSLQQQNNNQNENSNKKGVKNIIGSKIANNNNFKNNEQLKSIQSLRSKNHQPVKTAPAPAPAQASSPSTTTTNNVNIKGPVKFAFVNSYWTDNTAQGSIVAGATSANVTPTNLQPVAKVEVGPGEGASTLAVILINRGFSDITSITGTLDFPSGFKALVTPKNVDSSTSLATYDGIVAAGQTFVLYFPVSVLKEARVGIEYHGSLKIQYFKLTEQTKKETRSTTIQVPFTLSGKVILDTVSPLSPSFSSSLIPVQSVVPGISNVAKIAIRNDGSAMATGVVVTVTGVGGSSVSSSSNNNLNNVNSNTSVTQNGITQQLQQQSSSPIPTISVGPKLFNIGAIRSNDTARIQPVVFPVNSASGTLQNLNLQISYNDAYGNKKTLNQLVGFQILPTSPQPGLSISPSISPHPTSFSSNSHLLSSPLYRDQTIPVAISAADTTIVSSTAKNNNKSDVDPPPSSPPSPTTIQLTAGKVQDLSFTLNSNSISNISNSITAIAVSLTSQSSSVRILGNSQWNIQSLGPQTKPVLSTKVFASNSLIGTPVFFTITAQYIQNGQQLKTESFNLGAIVIGDIKITVNNLAVNYIGNTPNLVGNLLNEGNTPASFTTIEMLKQMQDLPPSSSALNGTSTITLRPLSSQYLGTLPANSPIPFSIPLKIIQTPIAAEQNTNKAVKTVSQLPSYILPSASTSPYLVPLKITYTDDLKNTHDLIVNNTLNFEPILQEEGGQTSIGGPNTMEQQQFPVTNGFVDAYWADNTVVGNTNNGNSSSFTSNIGAGSFPVPPQKEVGPGEGQSILAVVLSNTGFSDINGVVGYLTLPSGFSAATSGSSSTAGVDVPIVGNNQTGVNSGTFSHVQTQQQPSIASINNIVKAGQTYTLFFKVKILKTANVGSHSALLKVNYFKVPEPQPGQYRIQTTSIPFTLPGKVILDALSKTNDLTPGASNQAKIVIRNKGTADAHGVIVTVTGVSGNVISSNSNSNSNTAGVVNNNNLGNSSTVQQSPSSSSPTSSSSIPTVNLGARTFDVGTLPVNKTAEIDPVIYPSDSAGGTLQNIDLQITYSNANGDTKSADVSVGLRILPTPPEAGLSVGPSQQSPVTHSTLPNNSNVNNSSGGSSSSPSATPPLSKGNNNTSGLSVTPSSMQSATNSLNPIYSQVALSIDNAKGIPLLSTPTSSLYRAVSDSSNNKNNNSNSIILVAGRIESLNFTIANNNNTPITDAVITLSSQTSSVEILGYSQWTLQTLSTQTNQNFSTKVFASKSLIGSPVSFLVTLQYISNGQSKTGSFNLGANIVGDIKISINDLAINYIGGVPNLAGSLLNQGNTQALFTTIELIQNPFSSSHLSSNKTVAESGIGRHQPTNVQSSSSPSSSLSSRPSSTPLGSLPPPQYLGDLDADSPLPFSIPIDLILNNNTSPGVYPFSLKVIFSDDLKNSHDVIINKTVSFKPSHRLTTNQGPSFLGFGGGSSGSGKGGSSIFGIGFPLMIIIIAIVILTAIFFIRRKRRKSSAKIYSKSDSDIETFLEDTEPVDKNKEFRKQ